MATSVSYAELLKMSLKDLGSEIREHELSTQKMRMGITMGREKDTARYQRARRELARMKTALTAKTREEVLKSDKKVSTVPAPKPHPARSARHPLPPTSAPGATAGKAERGEKLPSTTKKRKTPSKS